MTSREYLRQYRQANAAALKAKAAAKRARPEEREKARQRALKWRAANRERLRESQRAWAEENRDTARASGRRWYEKNKQRRAVTCAAWAALNRPAKNEHKRARRALAGSALPKALVVWLLGQPCAYCGLPSEHVEHATPVSRGGLHDASNVIGACARCNQRKGAKTVLEFAGLWPGA